MTGLLLRLLLVTALLQLTATQLIPTTPGAPLFQVNTDCTADLNTDPNNCGSCSYVCNPAKAPYCYGGNCWDQPHPSGYATPPEASSPLPNTNGPVTATGQPSRTATPTAGTPPPGIVGLNATKDTGVPSAAPTAAAPAAVPAAQKTGAPTSGAALTSLGRTALPFGFLMMGCWWGTGMLFP